VSVIPTRHACIGPKLVIDRFDVAHNGAYAVWFGKSLRVETAEAERGARPWSLKSNRRTTPQSTNQN
jgi:competence protein ComEC